MTNYFSRIVSHRLLQKILRIRSNIFLNSKLRYYQPTNYIRTRNEISLLKGVEARSSNFRIFIPSLDLFSIFRDIVFPLSTELITSIIHISNQSSVISAICHLRSFCSTPNIPDYVPHSRNLRVAKST